MDLGVREAQQRRHPRNMNRVRTPNIVFKIILISFSSQASVDIARGNCHPSPSQLIASTPH